MMRRDRALEILKPRVDSQLVVAVYQTLFDWMVIHPRDLNYVATGAMGQASSHGLGLALANPGRAVLVFDGDGSLLMNLGSLVSIAGAAPGLSSGGGVCRARAAGGRHRRLPRAARAGLRGNARRTRRGLPARLRLHSQRRGARALQAGAGSELNSASTIFRNSRATADMVRCCDQISAPLNGISGVNGALA